MALQAACPLHSARSSSSGVVNSPSSFRGKSSKSPNPTEGRVCWASQFRV